MRLDEFRGVGDLIRGAFGPTIPLEIEPYTTVTRDHGRPARTLMTRHLPRSTRLVLEIAETRYALRAVACAEAIGRTAFRLVKDDGTVYDLVQTKHGAECDCPDFVFRRDGLDPKGCKHVQALVAAGMMDPPAKLSLARSARLA